MYSVPVIQKKLIERIPHIRRSVVNAEVEVGGSLERESKAPLMNEEIRVEENRSRY